MISAKSNRYLDHRRNHRDTLRISHDLVWDCLVFNGHDLIQHVSSVLNSFLDVGLVFVIGRPSQRAE